MHRVRVGDHFGICHEAIGCTYSEKKSIKHKNTKGGDFVSCTVSLKLLIVSKTYLRVRRKIVQDTTKHSQYYRIPGNFCGVKLLRIENFANKNVANCLLVVINYSFILHATP